jgi:hypothetical protein
MLSLNNFHTLRTHLEPPENHDFRRIVVKNSELARNGADYIIYKQIVRNIWPFQKLFVILHRFFAPIGRKMTSNRLIA